MSLPGSSRRRSAGLVIGHPFTPLLVAKLLLVLGIWAIGPVIDKVAEPRFRALAPAPGEAASIAFKRARTRFLVVEAVATGMFYGVTVIGVLL